MNAEFQRIAGRDKAFLNDQCKEIEENGEMAELYVKPGNTERGWNDPPQFSYGLYF